MATPDAEAGARNLQRLLAATVDQLAATASRQEAIGYLKTSKGLGLLRRPPVMVPLNRAWRLGRLLLDDDGNLFLAGKLTRAVEPGRPTNLSSSVEQRRADRLAASRGHFSPGEVINYEVTPIAVDATSLENGEGPLSLDGENVLVRWEKTGGQEANSRLDAYIAERMSLLTLGPWDGLTIETE
jgi:hypothetical protein